MSKFHDYHEYHRATGIEYDSFKEWLEEHTKSDNEARSRT